MAVDDKIRTFTKEDLSDITEGFSQENFITKFQYGSVFHGNMQRLRMEAQDRKVTVKIWDNSNQYYPSLRGYNCSRLREEVALSEHTRYASHPNMVKLLGYCEDAELLGVVYDLASHDTLHNLMLKDDFGWLQRMKVAIQFAYLLQFLHTPADELSIPCLIRNLDSFHIMVDTEGNAILFDFAHISGGIFPDRSGYQDRVRIGDLGCIGYVDPEFVYCYGREVGWSEKTDVFDFGIILLCLIAKKSVDPEMIRGNPDKQLMHDWARVVYKPNCSLVDHVLIEEAEKEDFDLRDGIKITQLAMQCTEHYREDRPTMKEAVDVFLDLHVTKCNALMLAVDPRILHDAKFRQAIAIRNQRFLYMNKRRNQEDKKTELFVK